jgi:hypothetical protein
LLYMTVYMLQRTILALVIVDVWAILSEVQCGGVSCESCNMCHLPSGLTEQSAPYFTYRYN